ncbi:hypothetical protein BXZ70DRAFT_934108 [Cristinia sonorae]|uniref:DUF6532 domain-containing protein n=1 Tax=Cristinia sonorae TaxID=1940300 RepID=A0A8K0URI8_9AGAR|nr:hypothetical protein BXZ70DRAFT_934078 [Cristinia sonorae]KAH8101612.1 hypothetical protein BXZ70DRAFT_934108 [Cristinia sonorae]
MSPSSKRKQSHASDSSDSEEADIETNNLSGRPARKSKNKLMENPPWKQPSSRQVSSSAHRSARKKQRSTDDNSDQLAASANSRSSTRELEDSESDSSDDTSGPKDNSSDEESLSSSSDGEDDDEEGGKDRGKGKVSKSKGGKKQVPAPLKTGPPKSKVNNGTKFKSPDAHIGLINNNDTIVGGASNRRNRNDDSVNEALSNLEIATWSSERGSPALPDRISDPNLAPKSSSTVSPESASHVGSRPNALAISLFDHEANETQEVLTTASKNKAPLAKSKASSDTAGIHSKSKSAPRTTNNDHSRGKSSNNSNTDLRSKKSTKREEKERRERPEFSDSNDEPDNEKTHQPSRSKKSKKRKDHSDDEDDEDNKDDDDENDDEQKHKRSSKVRGKKKRRTRYQTSSDSSSESDRSDTSWPSWMKLKPNTNGGISLKRQKGPIRQLLHGAISYVRRDCIFKTPHPELNDKHLYVEGILLKAAKKISPELVKRLEKDSSFLDKLLPLPSNRISHYRSSYHQVVNEHLSTDYGFSTNGIQLPPSEVQARVSSLKVDFCFVYRMQEGSYVKPMLNCPYQHPLIIRVLHHVLFNSPDGLGNKFADKFTSSIKEDTTPELPIPVVAMAGAAVELGLLSWATGLYIAPSKKITTLSNLYNGHLKFIEGLRIELGPLKLHRLFADLLASARSATYVTTTSSTDALAAAHKVDAANMPE